MSKTITLTHTGKGSIDPRSKIELSGEGYTLYFNDLADNLDQSQYTRSIAPPSSLTYTTGGNNTVSMALTDRVELSIESGSIANYLANGYVTAVYSGSEGGSLEVVEGITLYATDPTGNGGEDPDVNDQGIRINGKSGVSNGYIDFFYDDDDSMLRVIAHPSTNIPNDAGDADMVFMTSAGYAVGNDSTGGGEFRVKTGYGLDSNAQDANGKNGGDVEILTGSGGEFGGKGGTISITTGQGHGDKGGDILIVTGEDRINGNGGDIYLEAGAGLGVGNRSGNITLAPMTGIAGATSGNLKIANMDHGLLSIDGNSNVVSTGNGFLVKKETINVAIGPLTQHIIADADFQNVLRAESIITVTLQTVAGVTVATAPYVSDIQPDTNFTVGFDLTNGNVGAVDIFINYMIVG
jgi:hypothetical protein